MSSDCRIFYVFMHLVILCISEIIAYFIFQDYFAVLIPLWVYLYMRFVYFSLQLSIIFFCSIYLIFVFDLLSYFFSNHVNFVFNVFLASVSVNT